MQAENSGKLVVLGTGGTIAGRAVQAHDNIGYRAGEVAVAELLQGVPAVARHAGRLLVEQVAQVDSKDMDVSIWRRLLGRCLHHLADPGVRGIVVTHGTDTMEETAWFLHLALLSCRGAIKPVVLTGAMRPATSSSPDGPQNLGDALAVADQAAGGVLVLFAGQVHAAESVFKQHTYRLEAFHSGEAGPLAVVEEGVLRWLHGAAAWISRREGAPRPATEGDPDNGRWLRGLVDDPDTSAWPRVEIVTSHAGATPLLVDALLASMAQGPLRGIVVAGTGNGTVHRALHSALLLARERGVVVWRASRCQLGAVIGVDDDGLVSAGAMSPVKARIALQWALLRLDAGLPAVEGLPVLEQPLGA